MSTTLLIALKHHALLTAEQQDAVRSTLQAELEGSGDMPGALGRLNMAPDSWRAKFVWLDEPSVPPEVPQVSGASWGVALVVCVFCDLFGVIRTR